MSIDWVWLLMGACAVFALGWLASRFDIRQLKIESQRNPKAYFRGLNFLLNEQQDEAIDSFIQAVQQDPDTTELHFALGNLFRRRGEFERAVRVHEHLLARGDLHTKDRDRAKFDLAQDYLRAGIIDRAENTLNSLKDSSVEGPAMLALLSLYERSRDWQGANQISYRLEALGLGDFSARRAHYACEQALALRDTDLTRCTELVEKALLASPSNSRTRLTLANLLRDRGQSTEAFKVLEDLIKQSPKFAGLAAPLYVDIALELKRNREALDLLKSNYAAKPRLDVLEAMVTIQSKSFSAQSTSKLSTANNALVEPINQALYAQHLEHTHSLIAATQWLRGERLSDQNTRQRVFQTLEKSALPLKRYRCAACGFEASNYYWQCPGCQAWDSYPPERIEEL
jgi:lipopolysaccharide assembly protein B